MPDVRTAAGYMSPVVHDLASSTDADRGKSWFNQFMRGRGHHTRLADKSQQRRRMTEVDCKMHYCSLDPVPGERSVHRLRSFCRQRVREAAESANGAGGFARYDSSSFSSGVHNGVNQRQAIVRISWSTGLCANSCSSWSGESDGDGSRYRRASAWACITLVHANSYE